MRNLVSFTVGFALGIGLVGGLAHADDGAWRGTPSWRSGVQVATAQPDAPSVQSDEQAGLVLMRCVAHSFADRMGPYTTLKAASDNPDGGRAVAYALEACGVRDILTTDHDRGMSLVHYAVVYWTVR
jgi:hypothetical protein